MNGAEDTEKGMNMGKSGAWFEGYPLEPQSNNKKI